MQCFQSTLNLKAESMHRSKSFETLAISNFNCCISTLKRRPVVRPLPEKPTDECIEKRLYEVLEDEECWASQRIFVDVCFRVVPLDMETFELTDDYCKPVIDRINAAQSIGTPF